LSTHSTRATGRNFKEEGAGRGWRCFKASPPKKAPKVLFQLHHRRRRSLLQLRFTIVIIDQIKGKGGMVVDNPPPSQKNATLTLPDAHVNSKSTLHPNWPFSSSSCDLSNRPTTTHHPPVCREKYSKVVSKKA